MHFKVSNRPRDSLRDSISLVDRLDEEGEEEREGRNEKRIKLNVFDNSTRNVIILKVFIAI